jgi:hypothetical protein
MSKSDKYRRFAEECMDMARAATDERTRAVLIQMAQVWFRLAEGRTKGDGKEQLIRDPSYPLFCQPP